MIERRRLMAEPGTHVRQGDILAVAVAAVPAETEPVLVQSGARFPLVTGDADRPGTHLVTATSSVRAFRGNAGLGLIEWLEVGEAGLTLTHSQHGALVLEPGFWRIVRQREYDPRSSPRFRVD
jgi:hypothetical protein